MMESADRIMEKASVALSKMHYLECEGLCLEALAVARIGGDWNSYGRILLPLQESRRQRRMKAADGVVRLGSDGLGDDVGDWLEGIDAGCLVVTGERSVEDALAVFNVARKRQLAVEVLYAENPSDASDWTIQSFAGPAVSCPMGPPAKGWLNRWMKGTVSAAAGDGEKAGPGQESPAEWFFGCV